MLVFPYLYSSGGGDSDFTYTMSNDGLFQYPANVKIPNNVISFVGNIQGFYGHKEIKSIEWECNSTMSSIASWAFYDCTGLEAITIPDSIVVINNNSFYNCTSLVNVNINPQITRTWGVSVFANCSLLNDDSAAKIVQSAIGFPAGFFDGCSSITTLSIPYFGAYCCRGCTSLQNVTISAINTSASSSQMFSGCTALTSVIFTNDSNIKVLPQSTFENCTALQNIDLPETITSIGNYCFKGCTALQNIVIPHGTTALNYGVFSGCTALTYAYLPNTITSGASGSLYNQLFYNCTSLTNIELEDDWNCNLVISSPTLTGERLKAMFESLYDLTGGTAKTLTLGTTNFATAYSTTYIPEGETEAIPIATIATNKNWTLAA